LTFQHLTRYALRWRSKPLTAIERDLVTRTSAGSASLRQRFINPGGANLLTPSWTIGGVASQSIEGILPRLVREHDPSKSEKFFKICFDTYEDVAKFQRWKEVMRMAKKAKKAKKATKKAKKAKK
jgi:hypothetical protein